MAYSVQLVGATTIELAGQSASSPYALTSDGWAPEVAPRRRSALGGRGRFEDVVETIEVNVYGTSIAQTLARYTALITLLDQAEAWRRREVEQPLLLTVQLDAGATPVSAIVIAAERPIQPPARYLSDLALFRISGVQLSIKRRGEWLGTTQSATSASVSGTARMECDFGSGNILDVPGPLKLQLQGFLGTEQPPAGMLVVSERGLSILAAASLSGTGYNSVADAANYAQSTNVLRYTPSSTAAATATASGSLSLSTPYIAIYATLRNNSSSVSWTITASVTTRVSNVGGPNVSSAAPITIDTSSTSPRVVCLGIVAIPDGHIADSPRLAIAASSTSGSPTLDIDRLVFQGFTGDIPPTVVTQAATAIVGPATAAEIVLEPGPLTQRAPTIGVMSLITGELLLLSHESNLWLTSQNQLLRAIWLAPSGTSWQFVRSGSPLTYTLVATRTLAYRTPE